MDGRAQLGRLTWHIVDVVDIITETPRVKTLVLQSDDWPGHLPGQHVDVRLTAGDGYQAIRSYSLASPPEDKRLLLTVERLGNGEVSPFLADEVRLGDKLEVRGPIGGYFIWTAGMGGPLLLVGGGSGIVPLMAMARHRAVVRSGVPARLLYSCRTPEDVIYRKDLETLAAGGLEVIYTFTRERGDGTRAQSEDLKRYARRVDAAMLEEVGWRDRASTKVFVCGPHGFVEVVTAGLEGLGYKPDQVRTERFGPTG